AVTNANGSVVVGTSRGAGSVDHAFRWTSAGMVNIGTFGGGQSAAAYGVSGDGNVVVGQSGSAFRWTSGGGMQGLATGSSTAWAASWDGSVVAGWGSRAFRWTGGGGLEDLGALVVGGNSSAGAMTPDG